MRTEHPSLLVEVSWHGSGKPQISWVNVSRLAARRLTGGCVPMHRSNGSPVKRQLYGDFQWSHDLLNVKNIIEEGAPRLASGWEARAEAHNAESWRKFMLKGATP